MERLWRESNIKMEKKDKRKILNPYNKMDGHYCFACSDKNPFGLKLEFYEEGEELVCKWLPKKEFMGFENILHGGIQTTLIDEIGAWCVQIKHKTSGVTVKLENRFKRAVYCDKGAITLRAKIAKVLRNIVYVHVILLDADDIECSEAELQFFTVQQKVAKEKFHYPDYNSFFESNA